jgi:hypothetical protein
MPVRRSGGAKPRLLPGKRAGRGRRFAQGFHEPDDVVWYRPAAARQLPTMKLTGISFPAGDRVSIALPSGSRAMHCCAPTDPRCARHLQPRWPRVLLLACLVLPGIISATDASSEPSLNVRATLTPRPAAITDGRFVVHAVLQPQPTRAVLPMNAIGRLEPKSGTAMCYGPGTIFHHGFEGLLP